MVEKKNYRFKKTSQNEISLFTLLGESLCAVQIIEDALSHLIVLKKTEPDQKKEADNLLNKQRFYTFGKALNIAKKESLLPKRLEMELLRLLKERNWLIHGSITYDKNNFNSDSHFNKIFKKVKSITLKAHELLNLIHLDLFEYCKNKGIDMSNVENQMNKHYQI